MQYCGCPDCGYDFSVEVSSGAIEDLVEEGFMPRADENANSRGDMIGGNDQVKISSAEKRGDTVIHVLVGASSREIARKANMEVKNRRLRGDRSLIRVIGARRKSEQVGPPEESKVVNKVIRPAL